MAGSVNNVFIIGNLGSDPELKTVGNSQVANFSVATSESWTDGAGNKQEKTEWHRIVAWGKQAETAQRFLAKGRKVCIQGSLQTRSWDDSETGKKRFMTEIKAFRITFLDKAPEGGGQGQGQGGGGQQGGGGYGGGGQGQQGGGGQGQQGGGGQGQGGGGYGGGQHQTPPQGQQGGGYVPQQGQGPQGGGYGAPPQGQGQGQGAPPPQGGNDPGYFSDDDIPF